MKLDVKVDFIDLKKASDTDKLKFKKIRENSKIPKYLDNSKKR